jgi:putative ATPase
LRPLDVGEIESVLARGMLALGSGVTADDSCLALIAAQADGDARRALNLLELAADLAEEGRITRNTLEEVLQASLRRFDKGGDLFYDQISALHKAVRGSSPDAALYWLCRMLDGGCDPLYIARGVVRLGSPEGELAIAQAIIYLACAAKSNAVYTAYNAARADVEQGSTEEVPLHLRNAPTALMKDMEHGVGYRYAHDESEAYAAGENYFPEALRERQYYFPVERGLEQKIREKLNYLRERDKNSTLRRYT